MATENIDNSDDYIEAGGDRYHKKNVGGALAIMGGALTAFIITAPFGIPIGLVGVWLWYKHR